MTPTRVSIIVVACTAAAVAARQAPSEPPRFRVAVDVVSIDAVVTDRQGEVVRDLTAADFEVFQDGKRQKVTVAQFVPVITVAAPAARAIGSSAVPAPAATEAPGAAPPPITREQVRRTIVLVVDDLGLSVEGMNHTRRALRGFVGTGLLPTDLVAIVRTGESMGVMQSLTNDRRALEAAIDGLRYNTMSRKGVSPFGDVTQLGDAKPVADEVMPLQRSVSAAGSLAALNLVVQAARDLPGRKTVIVASEGFQLWEETVATKTSDEDTRVRFAVDRVIDQATRSGVVIYAIDGQALQPAGLGAADDVHSADPRGNPDAMGESLRGLSADRRRASRDAQESLAYLAEQTGGFAVMNTNDLAAGLSRISNDVRDYYVIGYEPDQGTFAPKGRTPRLHKIAVNVSRPGAAREGAQGVHRRHRSGAAVGAADAGAAARSRGDLAVQRGHDRAARHESARILTRTRPVRPHGAAPRRAVAHAFATDARRHQDGVGRSRRSAVQQRRRAGRHHHHGIRRHARAPQRPSRRSRTASCTPRACRSESPAAINCGTPCATAAPARSARSAGS